MQIQDSAPRTLTHPVLPVIHIWGVHLFFYRQYHLFDWLPLEDFPNLSWPFKVLIPRECLQPLPGRGYLHFFLRIPTLLSFRLLTALLNNSEFQRPTQCFCCSKKLPAEMTVCFKTVMWPTPPLSVRDGAFTHLWINFLSRFLSNSFRSPLQMQRNTEELLYHSFHFQNTVLVRPFSTVI